MKKHTIRNILQRDINIVLMMIEFIFKEQKKITLEK